LTNALERVDEERSGPDKQTLQKRKKERKKLIKTETVKMQNAC
jgi:hypothetical protein